MKYFILSLFSALLVKESYSILVEFINQRYNLNKVIP